MSLFRALIKTHHMTSRKKIQAITKSAKHNSCSVVLKTGKPPGVMIAEGSEEAVKQWVEGVKVGFLYSLESKASQWDLVVIMIYA